MHLYSYLPKIDTIRSINCLKSSIYAKEVSPFIKFTSPDLTGLLDNESIKISMDGKRRAFDNIAIEKFWRTLKQDEIYLHEYDNMQEAKEQINKFMKEYNSIRPHKSLNEKTPDMVYYGKLEPGRINLDYPIKKEQRCCLDNGAHYSVSG